MSVSVGGDSWMARCSTLLVISHVLPFPGSSGQQQRVLNKLRALRPHFHITFLTFAVVAQHHALEAKLRDHVDDVVLLPSVHDRSRAWYRLKGEWYAFWKGLKPSNYRIGSLEFSPDRIAVATKNAGYDLVLYEYWHAVNSVAIFKARDIPCVLDMHNILWRSYERQLDSKHYLPRYWKQWAVARYRRHEEQAWSAFDGLITINAAEHHYVKRTVPDASHLFYAPMGVDLELWPCSWKPEKPSRIAYYGGLGSAHNQADALRCYHQIMPHIWRERPETEFWVVGSNPPPAIWKLAQDKRVTVTGFVEHPQDVLRTMTAVLCPWTGTYGFRSRVVEVMALGVPIIATPEAVDGMEMEDRKGILLAETDRQMASRALTLLQDSGYAREQSALARQQVEEKYGFAATYGRLAQELHKFACSSGQGLR